MRTNQLLQKFKDLGKSISSIRCESTNIPVCPAGHLRNGETKQCKEIRPFAEIPGPKPLPIIGNVFRFLPYIGEYGNDTRMAQTQKFRDQFGDIMKLEGVFGRRNCVFIFDPEDIEQMYRQEGPWPSRVTVETVKRHREANHQIFHGKFGLFVSQGKLWHDFRKNVNQKMMQPRAIKPFVSQVDEISAEFVEKMRNLRDVKTLKLPPTFNNEINKFVLESTCAFALNHRIGCLNDNLDADSNPQRMINAAHDLFDLLYKLEFSPSLWKYYDTPNLKKMYRTLDTITNISVSYIDEAKDRFRNNDQTKEGRGRSLLENLLQIDEQTAYVMAVDMLSAGIETTGNASSFLLYHLSADQTTQEKLREEVFSVLPEKDSLVTYDTLNNIPYLKACIKEALRVSPISHGVQRTMTKDSILGGYEIPAGTDVFACHAAVAIEAKYFPQPKKFIPERWLRENADSTSAKAAHPFVHMPFGYGPRSCVGRRVAELNIETLVLKVLRNFRLEWTGGPLRTKDRFNITVDSPLKFKLTDV